MDLQKSTVLVTGASGSLGQQLVYELHRRGVHIIAHVRKDSNTRYIDSLGLEKRIADLRFREQIEPILDGVDAIIHTAAWVNFRQDRLTQFTGINTFGAIELFKAARKAAVKRFVHVSTVAATAAVRKRTKNSRSGYGAEEKVDEETPFNLDHLRIPYIMTKRSAETELYKLASEGPPELVIVNPSIIVAPSRTGDDRGKAIKAFSRLFMPNLYNYVNLVDIRDVAPTIVAALEKGRPGERYIVAGDNITIRELILEVSAMIGKTPHLVRIPRKALRFAARWAVLFNKLRGKSKISFYPDLIKMLDYDWAYSSMKARRELGHTNRALFITLRDLLSNSFNGTYMRPIDW